MNLMLVKNMRSPLTLLKSPCLLKPKSPQLKSPTFKECWEIAFIPSARTSNHTNVVLVAADTYISDKYKGSSFILAKHQKTLLNTQRFAASCPPFLPQNVSHLAAHYVAVLWQMFPNFHQNRFTLQVSLFFFNMELKGELEF